MNYRKSRMWMWIIFLIGILVGGYGAANDVIWPMAVGTIIVLAGLGQAFFFYCCPHCGESLMNVKGNIPKHCPSCGKKLK